MALIHRLPNEILLRILSKLDVCELLNLDKVCIRWKSFIKEFVVNRLTCIDEKAIDYPYGDFLNNFIRICHRVESLEEVFTGLSPDFTRGNGNPWLKGEMKNALIQVLSKLNAGAALPLSLLQDILVLQYPVDPEKMKEKEFPSILEARSEVARVLQQIRTDEFEAIKVKQLLMGLYDSSELMYNPFSIKYRGRPLPIVLGLSGITRLEIESLSAVSMCTNHEEITVSRNVFNWVSSFPRLETVLLERLEFLKAGQYYEDGPAVATMIKFRPRRCQLSIDEFLSLLRTLGGKGDVRTSKIVTLIDEWKKNDWIECCEFSVHMITFPEFISAVRRNKDGEAESFESDDVTSLILHRLFSSPLASKLHLIIYHDDEKVNNTDELLMDYLEDHNVFSQLKEFAVSFTNKSHQESDDDRYVDKDWSEVAAAEVVTMLLSHLSGSMNHMEKLDFDFNSRIGYCSRALLKSTVVCEPLPCLQELCYEGLPSWPFIVSVVQQARNLRCLIVTSQPFEDQRANVKWIKRLFDVLENSKSLCILVIKDEQLRPPSLVVRRSISKDNESDRSLIAAIEKQIHRLVSVLPKLHRVSIVVDTCDLQFDLNRYGATERLFIQEMKDDDDDDDDNSDTDDE